MVLPAYFRYFECATGPQGISDQRGEQIHLYSDRQLFSVNAEQNLATNILTEHGA